MLPVIALVLSSLALSAVIFLKTKKMKPAVAVGVMVPILVFQILNYSSNGADPFLILAIVISAALLSLIDIVFLAILSSFLK